MGLPVTLVDSNGRAIGGYSASASFTPAASSHTAGDAVGVAAEFALNAPAASLLKIVSASLLVAGGTNETSTWRVYLSNVTPPSALADDAPYVLAAADRATFIGYFDFAQLVDIGDSLYIEATPNKIIRLTGTSVFGYLVNLTTVTPAAVARTVTLHTQVVTE
jgi:hypothetical protein